MSTKTCTIPGCDRPFLAKGKCHYHYYKGRPDTRSFPDKAIPATCPNCGETYMRIEKNAHTPYCKTCSYSIGQQMLRIGRPGKTCRVNYLNCQVCDALFVGPAPRVKYCSPLCRAAATTRGCKTCGAAIPPKVQYCPPCREAQRLVNARKGRRLSRVRHGPRNGYRRRARAFGVVYTPGITRKAVLELMGWRCGICHQVIGKTLRFPHPRSASLDHIIPMAWGGGHTWDNVQPAHLICNSTKGDRDEVQAALFGILPVQYHIA